MWLIELPDDLEACNAITDRVWAAFGQDLPECRIHSRIANLFRIEGGRLIREHDEQAQRALREAARDRRAHS